MATHIVDLDSAIYTATGNVQFDTTAINSAIIDVNVTALRGGGATAQFFVDRQGTDLIWYPIYSSAPLAAAGTISTVIGPGEQVNSEFSNTARFRWTLGGFNVNTTVTSGTSSATQTVGSTALMLPGDVLHFVTTNANRTILSITDSVTVVLSSTISTTTSEVVNVTNTPAITFSASGWGR